MYPYRQHTEAGVLVRAYSSILQKSLDKTRISCYTDKWSRGSGGTGRRARLRGVWITPYGFKSRLPHQTKAPSIRIVLFVFIYYASLKCSATSFK